MVAALVCSGCAQPAADIGGRPPDPAETGEPGEPVDIARQVVADRTGLPPDAVEIISREYREFSDSGLGCPVAGMAYLQVITPGYRVLLRAAGREFDVRVAGSRGRICER